MAKRRNPHGETLPEIAEDVARRFRGFDEYGSEDKAIAALRRRSGAEPEECARAFGIARDAYIAAEGLVKRKASELWEIYKAAPKQFPDMTPYAPELSEAVPGLQPERAASVLSWVFYWHHLR